MLDFAAVSLVFQVSSGGYELWEQILEKTEEKSFRRQAAKLDDGVLGFRWKNCEQDGTSCNLRTYNRIMHRLKKCPFILMLFTRRENIPCHFLFVVKSFMCMCIFCWNSGFLLNMPFSLKMQLLSNSITAFLQKNIAIKNYLII